MNHNTLYIKMFKANYRKRLLLFICNAFLISVCLFFSTVTFNNGYNNTEEISFVLEQQTYFSIRFVFLFALFFIPYSHISYNMQKEKEYGVLETIGIDNSSIKYAVVLDNTIIALITLAAGFLLGTGYSVLFNKTFIKQIYPENTVGALSLKGYEVTALIIGVIYAVTILCIEVYISSRTVKKLLTDERKAKEGHGYSVADIGEDAVLRTDAPDDVYPAGLQKNIRHFQKQSRPGTSDGIRHSRSAALSVRVPCGGEILQLWYGNGAAESECGDHVVILDSGRIAAEGTPLELKNAYTGDFLTLYNIDRTQAETLHMPYEVVAGACRFAIPSTETATGLIVAHPEIFVDYELTKGKMDDVFLAVTGKKLTGGDEA